MKFDFKNSVLIFKQKYLNDIRFWILFFFVLRLYGITNAPLEISHNWRQTFTNLVARNFLETDNNIFYPRADIYGNRTGIVGTEFPLLNYLIYMFSKLFGYTHWYGRFINLIVSSFGLYYFYKLVYKYIKPAIAFNATIILMCSVWFIFSRKSMPDTFSISLVLIGIYYGSAYLNTSRFIELFYFIVFASLGILCKIPGLFLLTIFILPLIDKNIALKNKLFFCIASGIVIFAMSWWYFYWVPYLQAEYGNQLYFPRTFSVGLKELIFNWDLTLEKFYFSSLESYVAFVFFIVGLFFIVKRKEKQLFIGIVLCSIVFFFFMIKTGEVFSLHSYYVIPYTPIMAVIAAYSINEIKNKKLQIGFLFLIVLEAIANQYNDFTIKESEKYKLNLEAIADKISDKNDLIAINGGDNPQQLYFTHRRGWRLSNEDIKNPVLINLIKKNGCKYLFLNKHIVDSSFSLRYNEVYNDKDFTIYSLLK